MEKKTRIRDLKGKAKIEYIWDYYRWHILLILIAILFLATRIYDFLSYREPLFNIVTINLVDMGSNTEAPYEEFFNQYGYDAFEGAVGKQSLYFTGDVESINSNFLLLTALVEARDVDVFFWKGNEFQQFIEDGLLLDLSEVLSDAQLSACKEYLIYTSLNGTVTPYPCGISLEKSQWAMENGYEDSNVGILFDARNKEIVMELLQYLIVDDKLCEE